MSVLSAHHIRLLRNVAVCEGGQRGQSGASVVIGEKCCHPLKPVGPKSSSVILNNKQVTLSFPGLFSLVLAIEHKSCMNSVVELQIREQKHNVSVYT